MKEEEVPGNLIHVITCDTAFKSMKKKASGDESVLQHWGFSQHNLGEVYYLGGWGSNKWKIDDFGKELVNLAFKIWKRAGRIRAIIDERQPGGKEGAWEAYLRNLFADAGMFLPPLIMLTRQHTQKVERIVEAAGYWADGRVRLVRKAPGVSRLIRQMLQIGVSAHDDWADCAADVFNPHVYRPMQSMASEGSPPSPVGPYDQYLKTGILTNDGAVEAYDRLTGIDEEIDEWEYAAGL